MKVPELLAPAGNPERLQTALRYGADAVYLGMQRMSLRNFAENFSLDDLHSACMLAHGMGKRIYVTVNAFAHDRQLRDLKAFLQDISSAGADALILNDPGVLCVARDVLPEMKLHLSTQANTLNACAATFWHKQGISRIVLARELSIEEVCFIRNECPPDLELEIFVHGAMCVSYSGRCLLSNYINGRDSNRGECAQPCRWTYELREKGKDGAYFPIEQDEFGTYILNSRDLNLLNYLPQVIGTGIQSLKIEGRMKSIYYVAGVVNAYRMALDELSQGATHVSEKIEQELEKVSHRPYTQGFAYGDPGAAGQATQSSSYVQTYELAAVVLRYEENTGIALLEQRNRFCCGDELFILSPGDIGRSFQVSALKTETEENISCAPHPQQRVLISCPSVSPGDLLRKRI